MKCVVMAIREGEDCKRAVEHVLDLSRREDVLVHLLTVRAPLPQYVARFLAADAVRGMHEEEGRRTLAGAAAQER